MGVYILHYEKEVNCKTKYGKGIHYIGWTNKLERRMEEYKTGKGSIFTIAAHNQNIQFKLADYYITNDIKNEHNLINLLNKDEWYCGICAGMDKLPITEMLLLRDKSSFIEEPLSIPPTLAEIETMSWHSHKRELMKEYFPEYVDILCPDIETEYDW